MAEFLTTSQIAEIYGLADSTVRHYRSSGRLVPSWKTPGGHARYAMANVVSVLGEPGGESLGPTMPVREAQISGIERESFAPRGQHDLRSSGRGGMLSPEVVAIGRREAPEPSREGRVKWGGRLLRPRSRVAV
jgi:hypothetical protein